VILGNLENFLVALLTWQVFYNRKRFNQEYQLQSDSELVSACLDGSKATFTGRKIKLWQEGLR